MKENIKSRIFRLPIEKNNRLSFGCFIDGIIISDLGGRVYVKQSNKSRGTTICIKIPCENMGVE
jgi:K+-sensing histidine kinase KdpD